MFSLTRTDAVLCQKEKKTLDTLRLDLDSAKTKLRRAKTQPAAQGVSMLSFVCGIQYMYMQLALLTFLL